MGSASSNHAATSYGDHQTTFTVTTPRFVYPLNNSLKPSTLSIGSALRQNIDEGRVKEGNCCYMTSLRDTKLNSNGRLRVFAIGGSTDCAPINISGSLGTKDSDDTMINDGVVRKAVVLVASIEGSVICQIPLWSSATASDYEPRSVVTASVHDLVVSSTQKSSLPTSNSESGTKAPPPPPPRPHTIDLMLLIVDHEFVSCWRIPYYRIPFIKFGWRNVSTTARSGSTTNTSPSGGPAYQCVWKVGIQDIIGQGHTVHSALFVPSYLRAHSLFPPKPAAVYSSLQALTPLVSKTSLGIHLTNAGPSILLGIDGLNVVDAVLSFTDCAVGEEGGADFSISEKNENIGVAVQVIPQISQMYMYSPGESVPSHWGFNILHVSSSGNTLVCVCNASPMSQQAVNSLAVRVSSISPIFEGPIISTCDPFRLSKVQTSQSTYEAVPPAVESAVESGSFAPNQVSGAPKAAELPISNTGKATKFKLTPLSGVAQRRPQQ
eukprot:Filipodium_phascolosomae@DN5594_c0_g1_i1.p1